MYVRGVQLAPGYGCARCETARLHEPGLKMVCKTDLEMGSNYRMIVKIVHLIP